MLGAEHRSKVYPKPQFKGRITTFINFSGFCVPGQRGQFVESMVKLLDFGDAEELTLREFEHRFGDKRRELALRKLEGEALTPVEEAFFKLLTKRLKGLLPPPPPLEDDEQAVFDEMKLRFKISD